MRVIPYQPEHLEKLHIRTSQGECPNTVMNTAFTFIDGEDVVAIFGGFMFVPGVIHFWGMVSDLVKRHPVAFHRAALKVLDWYEANEKPRRMQMDVRAAYSDGCRWAEALGFKLEGTLKCWGPDGSDHHLYGRVV